MVHYSLLKERPIRFKSEKFQLFRAQIIKNREPYIVVSPIFSLSIQPSMMVRKLTLNSGMHLTK